jgi:hypothetical protein
MILELTFGDITQLISTTTTTTTTLFYQSFSAIYRRTCFENVELTSYSEKKSPSSDIHLRKYLHAGRTHLAADSHVLYMRASRKAFPVACSFASGSGSH